MARPRCVCAARLAGLRPDPVSARGRWGGFGLGAGSGSGGATENRAEGLGRSRVSQPAARRPGSPRGSAAWSFGRRLGPANGSAPRVPGGAPTTTAKGADMVISSPSDYRKAAKRFLPPFLFHYIDGAANEETTARNNVERLRATPLRQRILRDMDGLDTTLELFGEKMSLPLGLSPVGLTGMYRRRGETQAAAAASAKGVPFTLSSVSLCPIEEVAPFSSRPMWFQLYVLKDRGFMKNVLSRALAAGCSTLVFTVDTPLPGARYRDAHSGMSGPFVWPRRIMQAALHPFWAYDVGIKGRPHDLGNLTRYFGKRVGLVDYMGYVGRNFDQSIGWKDLEWIREFWPGAMVIKGILDPFDAKDAVRFGADGVVVSNHGGRQLDGVPATCEALPAIAQAVNGDIPVLADSGVRGGLDVLRMLALGADAAMVGRLYVYALAAGGRKGVENMIDLVANELRVAMTLTGVKSVRDVPSDCLADPRRLAEMADEAAQDLQASAAGRAIRERIREKRAKAQEAAKGSAAESGAGKTDRGHLGGPDGARSEDGALYGASATMGANRRGADKPNEAGDGDTETQEER